LYFLRVCWAASQKYKITVPQFWMQVFLTDVFLCRSDKSVKFVRGFKLLPYRLWIQSVSASHFTKDPEGSVSYWNSSFERKILDSFWHWFNFFVLYVQRKTVQSERWHCCRITVYISFRQFGSLNGEFWTGSEHLSPRVTYVDIHFFLLLHGVTELRVLLHLNNMHVNWEFST